MLVSRTKNARRSNLFLLKVVAKTHVSTGLQDHSQPQSSQSSRTATACFQPCRKLRSERITTAKLAKNQPSSARTHIRLLDFRDRRCYRRDFAFERGTVANSWNWSPFPGTGMTHQCSVMHSLMGCVPLALPVLPICRKHWQSQWHTSKHDRQCTRPAVSGPFGQIAFKKVAE